MAAFCCRHEYNAPAAFHGISQNLYFRQFYRNFCHELGYPVGIYGLHQFWSSLFNRYRRIYKRHIIPSVCCATIHQHAAGNFTYLNRRLSFLLSCFTNQRNLLCIGHTGIYGSDLSPGTGRQAASDRRQQGIDRFAAADYGRRIELLCLSFCHAVNCFRAMGTDPIRRGDGAQCHPHG